MTAPSKSSRIEDLCRVETPPRLGVVTVTYNSARVLEDFLRSVKAQTLPSFALYTVDNASTDGTLDPPCPVQLPGGLE